jgi:hypothetical protein
VSSTRLKKILHLKFSDVSLFIQSVYYLTLSKRKIKRSSFKKVAPTLGKLNQEIRKELSNSEYLLAEKIRLATMRASRVVPFRSVCMDQAMTGVILLKKHHIPCTLFLGVRKREEGNGLDAHAWVVCGDKIILGGQKSLFYTVTASFSNDFKA